MISLAQSMAEVESRMKVRAGNSLKGLRVADGKEIRWSDIWSNRNIRGKIEVNGQQQKFV